MKPRLAILRNEMARDHLNWVMACEEMADVVEHEIVDLTKDDWLERILNGRYDGLLAQPTGWSTRYKILYDERTGILSSVLNIPMIPDFTAIKIFENKKFLSYWLKANKIPHPATHVFYHLEEALEHIDRSPMPVVGKTSMGGGGSGVRILHGKEEAKHYARQTLEGRGAPKTVGPNWRKKGFVFRAMGKLAHPHKLIGRLREYNTLREDAQRDHLILQEFIPHDFEWRVVRLGDSFFAHKKLMKGHMASGSLLKEYGDPPKALLDFVKGITDRHNMRSQAVDIFESPDGRYLVNEMQCIFGQSDPYQMAIDGVPGRYVHASGTWVFEPGDFNRFESYLHRLQYFLSTLPVEPVVA